MTKTELIDEVMITTGMPRAASKKAVDAVTDAIARELSGGSSVTLPGFGTFSVRDRPAQKGRNPRTNEPIDIPPCKVVSFKAGKTLKTAVNEPD